MNIDVFMKMMYSYECVLLNIVQYSCAPLYRYVIVMLTIANRPHESCLWIIYFNKQSWFQTLLEKTALILFTIKIFRLLQLKCIKWKMTDLLLIATGIFEQRNDNHYDLTNNAQVHHISDENSVSWVRKYLIPRA